MHSHPLHDRSIDPQALQSITEKRGMSGHVQFCTIVLRTRIIDSKCNMKRRHLDDQSIQQGVIEDYHLKCLPVFGLNDYISWFVQSPIDNRFKTKYSESWVWRDFENLWPLAATSKEKPTFVASISSYMWSRWFLSTLQFGGFAVWTLLKVVRVNLKQKPNINQVSLYDVENSLSTASQFGVDFVNICEVGE